MNENTTPQIAGSQPNPAEIGIPSVAGKKTSPVKNRNLALMAALVVLMLVCIAFGFYQKHSARNTPPKPQEQATPMFSGRTLTLPPLCNICRTIFLSISSSYATIDLYSIYITYLF